MQHLSAVQQRFFKNSLDTWLTELKLLEAFNTEQSL